MKIIVLCALVAVSWTVSMSAFAQNADAPKRPEKTNSAGMKLVLIPSGEFQMGGHETPQHLVDSFAAYKRPAEFFTDEYPAHRVRITKPFYFGKYEVTIGQFRRFTTEAGYKTEAERDGQGGWGYNAKTRRCEGRGVEYNWLNPGFQQTDEHPVLNISWNDAMAYCQWIGKKEGKTYRLPSEAEWEYACRAGTTTRYNISDDPKKLAVAANVADDKGRSEFPHVQEVDIAPENAKFTVPVGQYPPNAWGLHDMHGNVWEWCSDWYGEDYYGKSPQGDPKGPDDGRARARRGGAWNSYPLWARSSFRNWNKPDSRCVNLGFRVVEEWEGAARD